MDEQTSFEARAVLAPRRARVARRALLVPVVALLAITWAGLNGDRSDPVTAVVPGPTTALVPGPTTVAAPPLPVEAAYPAQVTGIAVQRLGDLQLGGLGRDEVVALAGWYVASITDCPPHAAIRRGGSPPHVRGDIDRLAACVRSGVLYPSHPDSSSIVPTGVAVSIAVGVSIPRELEVVDMPATQVVVLGRFSKSSDGCRLGIACSRELVVDYVGWTPGA